MRRVLGVEGVVAMAVGGRGPYAFTALFSFALVSLQGPQVWRGFRIGLLVAHGECHGAEVRLSI